MNREDYKLIPLATLGLLIGLGEVIVRPFINDQAAKVRHVARASIQYYRTGEPDELRDPD